MADTAPLLVAPLFERTGPLAVLRPTPPRGGRHRRPHPLARRVAALAAGVALRHPTRSPRP